MTPAPPSPLELKKQVLAAGFEVFRVKENLIWLAERVRENLILDSGVAAVAGNPFKVRLVVRAQATQFPGEDPAMLFARARVLGAPAALRGYREVEAVAEPVRDPGGGPEPIDTWFTVVFERDVDQGALAGELAFALGVEKAASPG